MRGGATPRSAGKLAELERLNLDLKRVTADAQQAADHRRDATAHQDEVNEHLMDMREAEAVAFGAAADAGAF